MWNSRSYCTLLQGSSSFKHVEGRRNEPDRPVTVRKMGSGSHTVIIRGMASSFEVNCLVDTGSEVTLITNDLVRDLGITQIQGTKYVLSSFTQNRITTIGEVTIPLIVAGLRTSHRCIVVDYNMQCDILLGMDFVDRNQLSIDAKQRVVSSDWGESKFLPGEPTAVVKRIKVRTDKTTVIPPKSVSFVVGKLENQDKAAKILSGLFEPYSAGDGLLTAEALCHSEDNKVPVRVINTTDSPMVLYKRKLLGFLDPPDRKTQPFTAVKVVRQIVTSESDRAHHREQKQESNHEYGWTKERLFAELRLNHLDITQGELKKLKTVIWKHREVFSKHEFDLGTCNFFKARINLKRDAEPQYVPHFPTPYKQRDALQRHLDGLLKAGVIEESSDAKYSMWNSRVFLVAKPHQPGKYRFVADFRALNSQCLPDNYCLPNINTVTDRMAGAKIFSTFDLSKSFYQLDYDEQSVPLTAFTANGKRYVFKKLVMGHLSSSSQFARMVDSLVDTIPLDQLAYFLDDLMVASMDVESHLQRLDLLLSKLANANLKLTPAKCELMKKKVEFVGITISEKGISVNNKRVSAVQNIPAPRTLKECQKVMGFLNYNRKFVKNFAGLAKPIYIMMDKKKKFSWTQDCQEGFDEIKRRIAEGITLAIPRVDDPNESYVVTIDASELGFGAELAQWQDGELRTVAYFSKRVPHHKRQWSQHKLEFECLVETLQHFALYLKGTRFLVKTDCLSLLSLENMFKDSNATMIRRLNKLADFTFDIQHIGATANDTSDFLSRYLYKKRSQEVSTQTETETTPSRVLKITTQPDIQLETTDTEQQPDDVETEDEVVVNEQMLTSDWDPPGAESVELSKASIPDPCVCKLELNVLDQHKKIKATVKRIDTSSCITQQLELTELLDKQKILTEQNGDPILTEVKRWLKEGKPEKLQRLRLPPDMLTYWKQLHLVTLKDGILCKKWIRHDKQTNEVEIQRFLVIVPESLKKTILEQHHSSLITMHPGIDNTCDQIRRRYYWPRMREEVEKYVKSCITCGGSKQPHHYLKAPLQHVITYNPRTTISIDHIVPSKEGVTSRGYRLILSITDVFSGYVMALPCKTRKSAETIQLILHKWCLRFGYPSEILADNDTSFTSEFFNEVCQFFKTKVTHGTPYLCSSTSKAERSNKRINQALRVTLTDKQISDWDLYLNFVSFALNGIKSRHTGFSANEIMFGEDLNTPLDLEIDGKPIQLEHQSSKARKTAYSIYRTIRDIVQKARRNAALDFGYADNSYNKRVLGPYFKEGDWVYTLIECPAHKFSKRWQGPFQITKKIDDHLYVVDLGSRDKLMNISKLKPYQKSKYSPPSLNALATTFVPQSADCTTTAVTADPPQNQEDIDDRQGAEIEFEKERVTECQTQARSGGEATETHQNIQGIPDTSAEVMENHTSNIDNDWEIVEISPPTEPQETELVEETGRRTRARKPTNFLNIAGFGSKSYD